jgi:hypothetical protein
MAGGGAAAAMFLAGAVSAMAALIGLALMLRLVCRGPPTFAGGNRIFSYIENFVYFL